MSILLSDEERAFKASVDEVVEKVMPREYVRKCDQERQYPYEAYQMLVELGYIGLLIPEEYGGLGADPMMYCLFLESVGKYSYDFGSCFSVSMFTAPNIINYGTKAQIEKYITPFLEGKVRFSISITEPDAGSDAANLSTRAVLDGNEWVLNGQKVFSSGAHLQGNVINMVCRTDPNVPKHKGISIILVPNDTPGLDIRRLPTLARHATGTNEVFISDCRVPYENLLGEVNRGWEYLADHLTLERLAISCLYVGNAQQAVDDAVAYAKERIQFGRPIGQFQVIKHMLAQMQTDVDCARLMVYRGIRMLAANQPCLREASMAKLVASETLLKVSTDGMQVLGGYAQLPEYDMERYWREGKQATVGGGSSQIQRSVIAKTMGL